MGSTALHLSYLHSHLLHRHIITSVAAAAWLDHALCEFWSRPSRHITRVGVLCSPCGGAGSLPDADDRGAWRRFLLCVQCNLLLGFRLGMTGGAGPFQYTLTPGSLARSLSTGSASARLILSSAAASRADPARVALQQAFDPLPACFAVSLLSSLASSQIPAPMTTLAETPLLEVCPAKVGPRYLVFHQHLSWVLEHHPSESLHSNLDVERIVTAIWGPGSGSHLEYSASVPSLRLGHSPPTLS